MTIRPLESEAQLPELISRQPLQPFLQSWVWGDFQAGLGRPIWRLGVYHRDQLVGAALVIEHQLLLGKNYLYCPRGPVADTPEAAQHLFSGLRDLGKKERAMYVKVDPGLFRFTDDLPALAKDYAVGTTLQPQQTLVVNTAVDPNEILATMHPKTRYNIRLAEKKGVTVRWSTSDEDMKSFLTLMHHTSQRQGIRLHSDGYYQKLFTTLRRAQMAQLVVGEFAGAVRAAHLIIWCGQTATYLHGGSDDDHKDAMIPYLLQWATIKEAHQRGMTNYDLWGVAPIDAPTHKWAGITRFKRGFGGHDVAFPPALNSILQPQWYQAYRLAKRIRGGVDG